MEPHIPDSAKLCHRGKGNNKTETFGMAHSKHTKVLGETPDLVYKFLKVKARSAAERVPELTGGIAFQELCVQHQQATLETS